MLVQRRRRWSNNNPALDQRLVFAVETAVFQHWCNAESSVCSLQIARFTQCWFKHGFKLVQRLRLCANYKPALVQRCVP